VVKDVRALWDRLAHLGHLALLDNRGLWVQLVSMALMVPMVHLVPKEHRDLQVLQVLPVSLVCLVLQVYRDQPVLLVLA
jgi:hypothetical protein